MVRQINKLIFFIISRPISYSLSFLSIWFIYNISPFYLPEIIWSFGAIVIYYIVKKQRINQALVYSESNKMINQSISKELKIRLREKDLFEINRDKSKVDSDKFKVDRDRLAIVVYNEFKKNIDNFFKDKKEVYIITNDKIYTLFLKERIEKGYSIELIKKAKKRQIGEKIVFIKWKNIIYNFIKSEKFRRHILKIEEIGLYHIKVNR